ncbi:hypothetical protein PoB_004082000 [Plakobranchus ocellatus]|uniref:Uncharacterized protein n=1 Tax=Plakobranchus ocellatus TaxID=259542 RepID=A0AAV4B3Z8_9GAST|nr:hypothetical protein PoB_004082000 [Plakobranchus ocellatus]
MATSTHRKRAVRIPKCFRTKDLFSVLKNSDSKSSDALIDSSDECKRSQSSSSESDRLTQSRPTPGPSNSDAANPLPISRSSHNSNQTARSGVLSPKEIEPKTISGSYLKNYLAFS